MAANIVAIKEGDGRPADALTSHQIKQRWKYIFIATLVYYLTVFFVKWSVLLFLLRVNKSKRWVEMTIYLTLFLVFSSLAAATIVQLIQCKPISRSWDSTMKGNCLSTQALLKIYTITLGELSSFAWWVEMPTAFFQLSQQRPTSYAPYSPSLYYGICR